MEKVLASTDHTMKDDFLKHVDKIISTINPAILHDGSNAADALPPKTNLHICNQSYAEIEDFSQDLTDLVATCQQHTRCSAAYCLRTVLGSYFQEVIYYLLLVTYFGGV